MLTSFSGRKIRKFGRVFLTSFQGVFDISGSLLHLHSFLIPSASPVALWLISIGSVVASGPETFCSQVGGHIHSRRVPQNNGALALLMVMSASPSLKQAALLEQGERREHRN